MSVLKEVCVKLSVVIPCYNEAQTIAKVVGDFRRELPDAEIRVFDNNSTDGSAALAEDAGAIVCPVPQQGKGNVVRKMFRDVDADIYVMVDGDDTYPTEKVRELIAPIAEGRADMVAGDRLSTTYMTENKRPFHGFGNRLVCFLISLFWGRRVNDVMTGYRAFSRRFVKNCPVVSAGFEIETEMTLHALDKRLDILEIPIAYRDRPAGSCSKLNTFRDGFRVLRMIFNLLRFYRPMQFFGGLGLLSVALGIVFAVPVFMEYFRTGLVPRFPTLIFSVFLVLSGILSCTVALILDALKGHADGRFEIAMRR